MLEYVKMLHYFESCLKSLQHNTHSKAPVSSSHSAVLYCPAIPASVPAPLLCLSMSVCKTETGIVMYGLVVTKYGVSTHQYMYCNRFIRVIKSTDSHGRY
jgi:hypothetical protein